jgi:hypothetical protein
MIVCKFSGSRVCGCLLVVLTALLTGCGSSGYHVSGKATFDGKPIPVGKIYFTPDASKGNDGASGWADIKDGAFNTSASGGMGIVGGPTLVRIEGADGLRIDDDRPNGNPLFTHYETAVDLPKSTTTKDFDVPASAKDAAPPSAPAAIVP